tara:strand:+ start:599 stop:1198 length:600 start_codon:yes stop_codon:yes gene_type:complete
MSSTDSKSEKVKEDNKSTPPKPAEEKPTPQKPEETLPAFEKELTDRIVNQFSDDAEVGYVKENRTRINVKKEKILDVAKFIKEQTPFDHAESVSGVDYPEEKEIEVVYHLGSYTDKRYAKQILALSTRATREEDPKPGNDSTKLPSLRNIFYSVEFHERECFEMLGVYFEGHPDNRRLLLPEDWADIPPLRKEFRNKGR